MNWTQLTLDIGAFLLIVAAFPLIRTILLNRDQLRGWNRYGCLLTAIANFLFTFSGLFEPAWILFVAGIVNTILWSLVTIYSWRK